MNAVIYARFSSSGQREESIEGQIRECTSYAVKKGYKVVGSFADRALSGTNDRRPEFQRMIRESSKNLFDVVICWKHDRFARNRYDAAIYKAKLKNNNVKIEYAAEPLSDGNEAIILDSVLEGYAEYYSANLSENVKRGLYDSALKRMTLGQYCYGLMKGVDGRFVLNPDEAPVVKRIFEEYIAGKPAVQIYSDLNDEGYRTRGGNLFNKNSIGHIIGNPKYKGLYQYADIEDPEGIPPIVSPADWERANAMKDKHRRHPHSNADYILTGKLFCGHCGRGMVAGGGKSHTGKYYQYYQCRSKDKNPVPKDYIERVVTDRLIEVIHSDEMIQKFADEFIKWQSTNDNAAEIKSVQNKISTLEKEKDNIIKAISKGAPSEVFNDFLASSHDEIHQLKMRLLDLKAERPVIERDMVVWYLERFRDGDVDDPEWRKYLVRDFLQAVYLFDDGHLIMQLNYSGEANTISVDLLNEVEGSFFASSSPPDCANSNYAIVFLDGMLFIRC